MRDYWHFCLDVRKARLGPDEARPDGQGRRGSDASWVHPGHRRHDPLSHRRPNLGTLFHLHSDRDRQQVTIVPQPATRRESFWAVKWTILTSPGVIVYCNWSRIRQWL